MPKKGELPQEQAVLARRFSKIHAARALMEAKAKELIELQIAIVKAAIADKDYESALKANQWLIDHIPADAEGLRAVDASVDKVIEHQSKGHSGPTLQFGFNMGGLSKPAELGPAEPVIIDITPLKKGYDREEG